MVYEGMTEPAWHRLRRAIEALDVIERQGARVRVLTAALEQAQACILGETPDDCTPEQARQDMLDKIREALRNG